MYQGKFDAKARGQKAPGETLETILKERDAAIAAKAAKAAQKAAKKSAQSGARPAPAKNGTAAPAAKKPVPTAAPQKPVKAQKPAKPQVEKVQQPEKKGARVSGLVFYAVFFLFILINFIGIFMVLGELNVRLKGYQYAQPSVKSNEVFQQLFTDPDWEQLYALAGVQDTDFEGSAEYVRYMDKKVGSQELNYVETSAGLDSAFARKYLVRLGTEKIASFKIVDKNQSEGSSILSLLSPDSKNPEWALGSVELFFERNESFLIKKLENHVAYINGVPLDDSYTIQITSTRVDDYLPVGASSIRTSIQEIGDLMAAPEIVVYDETGTERMPALYNPETGMFEEQVDAISISEDKRAAVFGALEAKCGFMINAAGSREAVNKYFDVSSSAYRDIIDMKQNVVWNTDRGHEFVNQEILCYTQHSPELFSVRASVTMRTVLKGNTEDRDYVATESMFFILKNGQWCCTETMNIDISEPVGQVRLTFKDDNGNILSNEFYPTDLKVLQTPAVQVPAGKKLSGWYRITIGADGVKSGEVVFIPDENNSVNLNSGKALEAMTLYPHFEAIA